jgi:hypothetical protein
MEFILSRPNRQARECTVKSAAAMNPGTRGVVRTQALLSSLEMEVTASRSNGIALAANPSSTRAAGPETEIAAGVGALGMAMA